eukprot:TRINITY_DN1311_c0_g1_i1.p1 TRINITY_DN1311_c0_g1~~TRINITY_DN1311_c0_g1_i1.p1  ORF type:complete len:534 (-),score=191.69 TRINITY_DN1311_c0_g1_i1:34-1635(-)
MFSAVRSVSRLAASATQNVAKSMAPPISRGIKQVSMWSMEEEEHTFKDPSEIIRMDEIKYWLKETKTAAKSSTRIKEILESAVQHACLEHAQTPMDASEYVNGLTYEETATLLNADVNDLELMDQLYATAFKIKERIYGNRIVLFAPLYIANHCVNGCTYCGFNKSHTELPRSCLSNDDLTRQVQLLQKQGHRRLLLLTGEHPAYTFDDFLDALKLTSEIETEPFGKIRRVNVEIPPLSVSDFRRLKDMNHVGTYTVFQETYDPELYSKYHPSGPKADYGWRLQVHDRAMTAGIDDVGIGALFGLGDYRNEVMALLMHANHLQDTYGAGPHTISIPRIQPAGGAADAMHVPHPVYDADFKKLVAVLRCAVPYTGMILSTRESKDLRNTLLNMGISQLSAGSRTNINGYDEESEEQDDTKGQFDLQDERPLDAVLVDLMKDGYVPSFCTACYRLGRTGCEFMKIAKDGEIHNYCHPNAILTMKEYLDDYGSEEAREEGYKVLETETAKIAKPSVRHSLEKKLVQLEKGERDLYF